jgi:hypothetical protein
MNAFDMNHISPKSLHQLQHIFNLIGRRILPCYFFNHNPKEMFRWQFNCCRQTALVCAYFLDKLAASLNFHHGTNYQAQAWDGNFKSVFDNPYNHAWAFLSSSVNNDPYSAGLFVDVARISYPCMVKWGVINDPDFIYTQHEILHPTGRSIVFMEINRVELDWKNLLTAENEFYTSKPGTQICREIEHVLDLYGYDFNNFNINQ